VGLIPADILPCSQIAKSHSLLDEQQLWWDFIYRAWGGEFIEFADWIRDCFSQCDRLFRQPLHEPMMSAFPVTDVGLTGGIPLLCGRATRHLGITAL